MMLTVQVAEAVRLVQLLVWEKSPVTVMLEKLRVWPPTFCTVTVCAAEEAPSVVAEKFNVPDCSPRTGNGDPGAQPVRDAMPADTRRIAETAMERMRKTGLNKLSDKAKLLKNRR